MSAPKIAVIDDEEAAITNAAESLRSIDETLAWSSQIVSNEDLVSWKAWCMKSAPEELILILDLGLQQGETNFEPFQTSSAILSQASVLPARITELHSRKLTDGFAAGVIAATSVRIKKLLIILASGRGKTSEVKTWMIEAIAPSQQGSKQIAVEFAKEQATLRTYAGVVIEGAKEKWQMHFPNWHPDPKINRIIQEYGKPWISNEFDSVTDVPWSHEACQTAIYKSHAAKILSVKDLGVPEVKSLFMWQQPSFHPTKPSYWLTRASLLAAIKQLDINLTLKDGDAWQLPAMPGLAFLFALKALLSEFIEASPVGVELEQEVLADDVRQYVLRIKLASSRRLSGRSINLGSFDHACRFLEKEQSQAGEGNKEGLSAAIRRLVSARLKDVNNAKNHPWLKMFQDGCSVPVVQTSFPARALEFAWGRTKK